MVLDTSRSDRVAKALVVRQSILAFADALQGGGNLKLITELLHIRLNAAFIAFLDAPSGVHLRQLVAIEDDLLRVAATLGRDRPLLQR